MLVEILRYPELITSGGVVYRASAHAQRSDDGRWSGYLIFTPVNGSRPVMTARETTQSSFEALEYWARGISAVYLEGAIDRALALEPEARLERRLADIERIEADAAFQAEELERLAEVARAEAHLAAEQRAETERVLDEIRAEVAEEAEVEASATPAESEAAAAEPPTAARRTDV